MLASEPGSARFGLADLQVFRFGYPQPRHGPPVDYDTSIAGIECFMDREQFESMSLEHMDALYRMAMQLARHPDEASELVQETYLKALRAADRFEEKGGGMRPWLFKVLHNVFYTRVERSKRQPIAMDDFSITTSRETPPDEASPAWNLASLDWEQVDDRIKEAMANLRPEYRSVLLLWGVEGLKYREIAEIHDVPLGTVMSRLHRARSILAAELAELAEEFGWSESSST